MNKRIQAMAASHFPRDGEGNIHATPEIIGEFAELIVKECANICFSEADGHRIAFGEHCGIVIKEHFGVEE